MGPHAEELLAALLVRDHRRALAVLLRGIEDIGNLDDIEELVIAPAVTRLGQLWLRGRLGDAEFEQIGALAERVERSFRHHLASGRYPSL
jgi:hypothetical protein